MRMVETKLLELGGGLKFANQDIQIDHFGYRHAAPRQGQQVLNDIGRLLAGFLNRQNRWAHRVVLGQIHQQESRIAHQTGKHIVQIVGHPAGQQPDGFHLLGPAQPFLQLFAFGRGIDAQGNVAHDGHGLGFGNGDQPAFEMAAHLVDLQAVLENLDLLPAEGLFEPRHDDRCQRRREYFRNPPVEKLFRRQMKHIQGALGFQKSPLAVEPEHQIRYGVQQGPAPGFAFADLIFGAVPLLDFTLQGPFAVAHRGRHFLEPRSDVTEFNVAHGFETIVIIPAGDPIDAVFENRQRPAHGNPQQDAGCGQDDHQGSRQNQNDDVAPPDKLGGMGPRRKIEIHLPDGLVTMNNLGPAFDPLAGRLVLAGLKQHLPLGVGDADLIDHLVAKVPAADLGDLFVIVVPQGNRQHLRQILRIGVGQHLQFAGGGALLNAVDHRQQNTLEKHHQQHEADSQLLGYRAAAERPERATAGGLPGPVHDNRFPSTPC